MIYSSVGAKREPCKQCDYIRDFSSAFIFIFTLDGGNLGIVLSRLLLGYALLLKKLSWNVDLIGKDKAFRTVQLGFNRGVV